MASSSMHENRETNLEDPVSEKILDLDPKKNDRIVMKVLLETLEHLKNDKTHPEVVQDEFVYCFLNVQSAFNQTSKLRFRVKLSWTGLEVKIEIHRLYEIPTHYQVLIINSRVISDHENLHNCEFREQDQTIFIILTKKRIRYQNSGIRIGDIIPERNSDVTMGEEDGASLMTSSLSNKDPLLRHENGSTSGQGMELDSARFSRHNEILEDELSHAPQVTSPMMMTSSTKLKMGPESGYFSTVPSLCSVTCAVDSAKPATNPRKKNKKKKNKKSRW